MIKHRPAPRNPWPSPCGTTVAKWAGVVLVAGVCLWIGLSQGNAATGSLSSRSIIQRHELITASSEFAGPFTTMRVPAVCTTAQTGLRYYQDQAPAGTAFLRSGAHGHGGYLKCIYFYVDGPLTGTDHHYGKWLVFTAGGGLGLLIGPDGIEASYVNCALPGYSFPFPVGNGLPNDCGESWVGSEDQPYLYQDNTAGQFGNPMHPAMLP